MLDSSAWYKAKRLTVKIPIDAKYLSYSTHSCSEFQTLFQLLNKHFSKTKYQSSSAKTAS